MLISNAVWKRLKTFSQCNGCCNCGHSLSWAAVWRWHANAHRSSLWLVIVQLALRESKIWFSTCCSRVYGSGNSFWPGESRLAFSDLPSQVHWAHLTPLRHHKKWCFSVTPFAYQRAPVVSIKISSAQLEPLSLSISPTYPAVRKSLSKSRKWRKQNSHSSQYWIINLQAITKERSEI